MERDMTDDYVANDFSAIRKAMEELNKEPVPYCAKCQNGGWMQVFSNHPPAFDVCNECYNPEGLESP